MMFFNFQRFFAGFGSVLDPLLEKEDCTLEKILDEDTLAEIKNSGAQKFGSFVTKNIQTYAKLISYLNINEDEGDSKTQIRYPFMISEAVGNDNGPIIDYLFEPDITQENYEQFEEQRQQFLPLLFSILDRDHLNVTIAGYFGKILGAIIRRKGLDVMYFYKQLWKFLSGQKTIISNLIKNLDVFHIAEVVERLIILETQQEHVPNQCFYYEERRDLLRRVLRYMEYKTHQSEVVDNCCHILIEVLNKSEAFLNQINQPEKLFTIALNSGSAQVVQVLITLLEAIFRFIDQRQEEDPSYKYDFASFIPIGVEFRTALAAEKISISAFDTTYGEVQQPFSQMKLKLLHLYLIVLRTNNESLVQVFDHQGIYFLLQKYLLQYEFNNQLQNLFYEITVLLFDKYHLNIVKFIIDNNKIDKQLIGKMINPIRRGYVGILNKLTYYLIPRIENNPEWDTYLSGEFEQQRQIENEYMLGVNPKPQKLQPDPNEDNMKDILSKIPIKPSQQPPQQESEQTVEIEVEEEEEQQDIENDDDDDTQPVVHQGKKPIPLDVEEIEKVIKSPETSPKDGNICHYVVEQIIQFQEQSLQPETSEIITDQTVNTYWKTHEGQEYVRKNSSEDMHAHKHHHHDIVHEQTQEVEEQQQPQEEQAVQVQDVQVEEINSPEPEVPPS